MGGREGNPDSADSLDDTCADLDQSQPQGAELGTGQWLRRRDRGAQPEHQPERASVRNETDLVGECGAATGAVGGKLALIQLNQVLGLATGTIESVIQLLGAATGDVGDDEADIEAFGGGLDARSHASWAVPGFGAVASLGIAAQRLNLFLGSANPDIIGGLLDQSVEVLCYRASRECN